MSNLSGFWVGHYAYDGAAAEAVDFDVEITQEAHMLSGIVTEPNSFISTDGELLTAEISGVVSGARLTFLKTYVGGSIDQRTVTYNGDLDGTQNHVSGVWVIDELNGTFEMRRDGPAVGVKAKTAMASLEQMLENVKTRDP